MDIKDAAARSRNMAAIRAADTKPEMILRRALHARGLRYRLHRKDLPGTPDLVLPGRKAVIFVHGCFWHRHPGCRYATTPATRPEFWQKKFEANIRRDRRVLEELQALSWRVAMVWECQLKRGEAVATEDRLVDWLAGDDALFEMPAPAPAARAQ